MLLAGGESRRMGRDKRLLEIDGQALIDRNVAFLRSLFPTVAVSMRDPGQVASPLPAGVDVLYDEYPGSPLGGIATALLRYGAPVFVLASDVVFPDPAAVAVVLDAFVDVDVALPVVDDHLEPLHAAYGPGCLPVMRRLLDEGRHSLLDLLPEVPVVTVPFHTQRPFFNVNTPQDWETARHT